MIGEQFHEQPKDEEFMEKFQYHRKFLSAILKTSFKKSRIVGGIKDTGPSLTSRNKSRMLFKSINGQFTNKSEEL